MITPAIASCVNRHQQSKQTIKQGFDTFLGDLQGNALFYYCSIKIINHSVQKDNNNNNNDNDNDKGNDNDNDNVNDNDNDNDNNQTQCSILAAQEQALRTNSINHSVDKTSKTRLCRLLGESTEAVWHIVSG